MNCQKGSKKDPLFHQFILDKRAAKRHHMSYTDYMQYVRYNGKPPKLIKYLENLKPFDELGLLERPWTSNALATLPYEIRVIKDERKLKKKKKAIANV